MEYTSLGSLRVSEVALGCWAMGGHGWGHVDDSDTTRAVRCALDLGINFFDTSDVYGFGHSERVLSAALDADRSRVVIATKLGLRWDAHGNITRDIRPERLTEALDASLRRLRVEQISLLQIHWPDGQTAVSAGMEALLRCQEAGKVGLIGCCNFSATDLREACAVTPLASAQVPFNLLDRRAEAEVLPTAVALGAATLAYSPLALGLLSGKYREPPSFPVDDVRSRSPYFRPGAVEDALRKASELRELAGVLGRSAVQIAIRWVLDHPSITGAIVGFKNVAQVQECCGASGWRLRAETWQQLAGQRRPE